MSGWLMCVTLLGIDWFPEQWREVNSTIPAGFWIGQHHPPAWQQVEGGWVHEHCFLSSAGVLGQQFWMMSSGDVGE
jgi:hypothetical protein